MLGLLSDRERVILVSRFGLEGVREKTLRQLGEELGITKERVRQLESRARAKLRLLALEPALEPPRRDTPWRRKPRIGTAPGGNSATSPFPESVKQPRSRHVC
jgi:hypothetical protein